MASAAKTIHIINGRRRTSALCGRDMPRRSIGIDAFYARGYTMSAGQRFCSRCQDVAVNGRQAKELA